MKVVLTDDVVGVGDIGEEVNVRPGFARNYLVPRGLAIEAEARNAKAQAHRLRQIESKKRRQKGIAEEFALRLKASTIVTELRVGERGRVFGSLTARDIAARLVELGFEIDRRRVLLAEPIKKLGSHPVRVRLHQDVEVEITVVVNPRQSSDEETEQDVQRAKSNILSASSALNADDEDDEDMTIQ